MNLSSQQNERQIVQHALEWYLSELRQEIAKTEKYDMRMGLHHEENILKNFISQLHSVDQVCISPQRSGATVGRFLLSQRAPHC